MKLFPEIDPALREFLQDKDNSHHASSLTGSSISLLGQSFLPFVGVNERIRVFLWAEVLQAVSGYDIKQDKGEWNVKSPFQIGVVPAPRSPGPNEFSSAFDFRVRGENTQREQSSNKKIRYYPLTNQMSRFFFRVFCPRSESPRIIAT